MRYNFNNFINGYSAMVSSHGYFFINKGKESAFYPRSIYKMGVYEKRNKKLPMPEYVYEGKVKVLGIKYIPTMDDIEEHNHTKIKKLIKKFVQEKLKLKPIKK